jgi:hypothetical protein
MNYSEDGSVVGANSGATPSLISMSTLSPYYHDTWKHYKDKQGINEYFAAARQAGMSPAQQALIMATGIWEDNAKKLTGQKSLTHVTQDVNGQRAFGIMNWIPKGGGTEAYEYGKTLSEQLNYISQAYFGANPTRRQGRITSNISGYSNALAKLAGHPIVGKEGDPIGPIIDRDLIEGSGHYVGGALVPAGWNTPSGLGKYVGTAVDVYNWMVQNGMATGQVGGSSYGGTGGSIYGSVGSRVQALLAGGGLNNTGNNTLGTAISSAIKNGSLKLMNAATLTANTAYQTASATKDLIGDAIDSSKTNYNSTIEGLKNMIGNRITTTGQVVADWWNNVKQVAANTDPTPEGILATFKDIGSSIYDTGAGIVGSIKDDLGQESQLVWNGVTKELSIIKGTAESVATEIANGISQIASSALQTNVYGDSTKGSKLDNLIAGKYGMVSSYNPNASNLIQAYNAQLAVSMGWGLNNGSSSSYMDGSYDDGSSDDDSSTIAQIADNSDMWTGYEQAVDARTKAQWKKMLDNHRSEWPAKTRNGKNPTGWWDAYLTNKRIADYYRLEYPGRVVNEAFSRWYASKFGKSTNRSVLTGSKSSPIVVKQQTAPTVFLDQFDKLDTWQEYVDLLKANPQYINDPNVKNNFDSQHWTSHYNELKQQLIKGSLDFPDNRSYAEQIGFTKPKNSSLTNFALWLTGNGDEAASQIVIPPVDDFAIQQQLGNMQQEEQPPTVVNQFLVGKNTTDNTDWIAQLEQATFNVRAERVEALLEEISKKMDSVNNNTTVVTPPQPTPEESPIPDQVTMLARG